MSIKQREQFDIKTKYRLSDGCFGIYGGEYSFDVEEGVMSTDTMTQEELLSFRKIHWLVWLVWNQRLYYDYLKLFQSHGINPMDFIISLVDNLESSTGTVRQVYDDFKRDTYLEWHDSPEALKEFYLKDDNFEKLKSGKLGGKLNLKFQWRILLECHEEFSQLVLKTGLDFAKENKLDLDQGLLSELIEFLELSILDFSVEPSELGQNIKRKFHYEFLGWRNSLYEKPIKDFYKEDGFKYSYSLDPVQKEALEKIIKQYAHQSRLATYRKMGDYMNFSDLFYQITQ